LEHRTLEHRTLEHCTLEHRILRQLQPLIIQRVMQHSGPKKEEQMIRLIAGTTFALFVATSVQAMTPAPIPHPDGVIKVAFGCGVGQTLVNGACVARTTIRQARREAYGAYGVGAGAPYYAGVVHPNYAGNYWGLGQPYYTVPHYSPYNHHIADTSRLPWDAVRVYYAGGPWYWGSNGWADYAARAGIGCTPGTLIKGGDGITYVCQ
jgi:hypothetical protein